MENKSNVFERIEQFSKYKGFKNLSDFSHHVGFPAPEKVYRLGRSAKNKPSFDMLVQIGFKFPDLNLHWLITGEREMTMPYFWELEDQEAARAAAKAEAEAGDLKLKEDIALLKQQLQDLTKNEKEMAEKIEYIYKAILKTELSEDIEKTINKIKEKK